MEHNIRVGLSFISEQVVEPENTAQRYGSGLLQVFATPAMVALMECAALHAVKDFLSPGFDTVGVEINVKHVKATPLGMKVRSEATLTQIEGKRLVFAVKAYDEQGEIGFGTHVRYIIDSKKFMEKLG